MEDMKIYLRQLEECYKKVKQEKQIGEVKELRVRLGNVIDKIRCINAIDDVIHAKSREMNSLIVEVSRDIDDLERRYHIF